VEKLKEFWNEKCWNGSKWEKKSRRWTRIFLPIMEGILPLWDEEMRVPDEDVHPSYKEGVCDALRTMFEGIKEDCKTPETWKTFLEKLARYKSSSWWEEIKDIFNCPDQPSELPAVELPALKEGGQLHWLQPYENQPTQNFMKLAASK